jgi:hypothetical protein
MKQKQYCVNKFHVCYKLSSNESMDHSNLKIKITKNNIQDNLACAILYSIVVTISTM